MGRKRSSVKTVAGKKYWMTGKAAEWLGISKNTLLSFCRMELVSHLRMGKGGYLFLQEDLENLVMEKSRKINTFKPSGRKRNDRDLLPSA